MYHLYIIYKNIIMNGGEIMKKEYVSPKAVKVEMTYETVYSKKCDFADYKDCCVSEQQFK